MDGELEIEEVDSDREGMDLVLDDETPTEPASPEIDENSENLVRDYLAMGQEGKQFLQQCSETVIRNFKEAWDAAEGYRKIFKDNWALFAGELPPKDHPWKDAANVNIPMMLENLSRLVARAEGELFGDWRNVFGVESVSISEEDRLVAEVLNQHGNWQIREQIPDFRRQLGQRGLLAYFWIGDVTVHSYYDAEQQMNRHEVLTPDEFVVPFAFTTTMPDYRDCPWVCKIVHYQRHQVEAKRGEWVDVDVMLDGGKPSWEDEPDQDIAATVARVQGVDQPDEDSGELTASAPYKVLWYEGWMRIPGQLRDRYVQALVHEKTRVVLKLTIHEEEDWQDKQRYMAQEQELQKFRTEQQLHSAKLAELEQMQHMVAMQQQHGVIAPEFANAGFQDIQMQIPPLPTAPHWMKNPEDPMEGPEPPRRVPHYMFSHGVCIEQFVGPYGLSYGRIQGQLNRAANTMTNQFIDSATLANVSSFLVTDGVDFGTNKPIRPGTVNRVKGIVGDELSKNIMPLKFAPANPQLIEMVGQLKGDARTSMQAPEVLSGEPGKSGETYRGISARIEQATKQLSVYVQHYAYTPLEQVLKNNAKLNAKFLKEEEIVGIALAKNGPKLPFKVRRDMYQPTYKATISSDLRFATQAQRIQEADELASMTAQVPQLMQNPAVMKAVTIKRLKARGMDDLLPLVEQAFQPPPMPGAPPPGGPPGGAPPGAPSLPMPGMPPG
jgi:hypothetical protein